MVSSRSMGSHQRAYKGQSDVWLTPPYILEALGPFDLDPCAATDAPWPTASAHYTEQDDGLRQPWHGFVWCNPPYGPATWRWLQKLADHHNGLALIFARTETAGFFDTVWRQADAILFLEGRLHFHTPDGIRADTNSGAPSCLVAYGPEAVARLTASSLSGALCSGWHSVGAEQPSLLEGLV
jgi:hypothetical protein